MYFSSSSLFVFVVVFVLDDIRPSVPATSAQSPPSPKNPHDATPRCHPDLSICCCNSPIDDNRRANTACICDTLRPILV